MASQQKMKYQSIKKAIFRRNIYPLTHLSNKKLSDLEEETKVLQVSRWPQKPVCEER